MVTCLYHTLSYLSWFSASAAVAHPILFTDLSIRGSPVVTIIQETILASLYNRASGSNSPFSLKITRRSSSATTI